MLRNPFCRLALAVGWAVVAVRSARANLYVDVQNTTATDGSTAYRANVAPGSETFTLDVYGLVTDASPDPSTDSYLFSSENFFVASSVLKGNVSFGAFSSNVYGINSPGIQFTTPYGALGLGGTSASDTNPADWVYSPAATSPFGLTGGAPLVLSGGTVGIEYFLGTLSVSFTGYSLPVTATTASLASTVATKLGTSTPSVGWEDSANTYSTYGTASNVGNGGNGSFLYAQHGAGLQFVFSNASNPAAMSAALGISGPTTVLGGTAMSLTGNVTNRATAPANALNWNSAAPGVVTLTPAGSNGVAAGASNNLAGSTLLAATTGMGPWVTNVTFSGTDTTAGTAAIGSPITIPLSFNIIGKGAKGTADGQGTPGDSYGVFLTTQGSLASGYALAGLTSTLGSGATSYGIGATTVSILAGTLGASSTGVAEQWRSRSSGELPQNSNSHAGLLPLYSDVVNLSGITGGSNSIYVLQMTYDPATLGGSAGVDHVAANGLLYLGYRSTVDGKWHNATSTSLADGDTSAGSQSVANYQGSYASFTASVGGSFTLAGALGAWGVDTANNDVWAVIDHDAEFAAVPEPGTIALLAGGVITCWLAARRKKPVA